MAEHQLQALIFCLVAFGYIDSSFDRSEKDFIRAHIGKLVEQRAQDAFPGDAAARAGVSAQWRKHYGQVLDEMDRDIMCHFTESVCEGESTTQFVVAKLKQGCFELLKRFDSEGQAEVLAAVDELMRADGKVHPAELSFRRDIAALLAAPIELDDLDIEPLEEGRLVIDAAAQLVPQQEDHPFLKPCEWAYAKSPEIFATQCQVDLDVIAQVRKLLDRQRQAGEGKLERAPSMASFAGGERFLDRYVYVFPAHPAKEYELLVLGDLHGCYSCLKSALLQVDFFEKMEAYESNPRRSPPIFAVFLGDYIDRGRFSYDGTLRAVMQLFLSYPEHVFLLRGNHEHYVEINGRVLAPVRPCEAMDSIKDLAPPQALSAYMKLFESLPHALVFEQLLFVHGGVPRDKTLAEKWTGLHSLNDDDIRFEMLWSDPADTDAIPRELQDATARFPFGRRQFRSFMARLGCKTMVRGHERVKEGFRRTYDDPEGVLLSLFSAGGADNDDLPATSNYREVTPMALTIRYRQGVSTITPFRIEYRRFNAPANNAFFRSLAAGSA